MLFWALQNKGQHNPVGKIAEKQSVGFFIVAIYKMNTTNHDATRKFIKRLSALGNKVKRLCVIKKNGFLAN